MVRFNTPRQAAKILFFGLIQFIFVSFLAMLFYSGGNLYNPIERNYNFSQNVFSDLGLIYSYNGDLNLISSFLFLISLTLIGIVFIPFSMQLPKIFPKSSPNHFFAIIGKYLSIFAAFGYIGIGMTPYNQVPTLHNLFVFLAFGLTVIIGFLYSFIVILSPNLSIKYLLGFFFMILAIFSYPLMINIWNIYPTAKVFQIMVISQKFAVYAQIFAFSWFAWGFSNLKCNQAEKTIYLFKSKIVQKEYCPNI